MIGSLRDQLLKADLTAREIQQFDILAIADDSIVFPEQKLGQKREKHERRFVIVLQNDKDNQNPVIKIVLVAPLSSKKERHRLDYLLYEKTIHFFQKTHI